AVDESYRGVNCFAPLCVFYAEHAAFRNRRMTSEHRLDIAGKDLEPSGVDYFTQPAADEQVAAIVDDAQFTGVQPIGADGLRRELWPIEIAIHHEWSTDDDLSYLAARKQFAGFVHDLDSGHVRRSAHGFEILVLHELGRPHRGDDLRCFDLSVRGF